MARASDTAQRLDPKLGEEAPYRAGDELRRIERHHMAGVDRGEHARLGLGVSSVYRILAERRTSSLAS